MLSKTDSIVTDESNEQLYLANDLECRKKSAIENQSKPLNDVELQKRRNIFLSVHCAVY